MDESSNPPPPSTAAGWERDHPTARPPAWRRPVWQRQGGGGEDAILGLITTLFGVALIELLLSLGWISS